MGMKATGHNCPRCGGEIVLRVDPLLVGKPDYVTGISGLVFAAIVNLFSACLIPFGGGRRKFVCEGCGVRFRRRMAKARNSQ